MTRQPIRSGLTAIGTDSYDASAFNGKNDETYTARTIQERGTELSGALSGVRVLDLTRVIAGPAAAQMLGDLGAEVIKIERPGEGDDGRRVGHVYVGGRREGRDVQSNYFVAFNRNKRGITVDFTKPGGREILRSLAEKSDVLIENYKTGVLARYGLDYESLRKVNPALVYCSVTGYGQTGPYRERPGFDPVFQAQCGLMSVTGVPDGEPGSGPVKVGISIIDWMTGLNAAVAVLAALRERDAVSGQGQHIDLSLLECGIAAMSHAAQQFLMDGTSPVRMGIAGPGGAPIGILECADGQLFISVSSDAQFKRLCDVLGCPEFASDARFLTNPLRVDNRGALLPLLSGCAKSWKAQALLEALIDASVSAGMYNNVEGMFADPQVSARGVAVPLRHPQMPGLKVVANPLRLSRTPPAYDLAPPGLGEHTDTVLASVLGYGPEQIHRLREEGAI